MNFWRLHTAQSNLGRLEPLFPLLTQDSRFNCYLYHFRWVRRSIFHENPEHVNRFVTQGSPNAPSDPKKQSKKAQDHPQHLKLKLEAEQGRRKEAKGIPKETPGTREWLHLELILEQIASSLIRIWSLSFA